MVFHRVVPGNLPGIFEADRLGQRHLVRHWPVCCLRLLRHDREPVVESGQELLANFVGLVDVAGAGQAQLGDQPVLEGFQHPLHPSLGLGGEGEYLLDAQFPYHLGELGGFLQPPALGGRCI